MALCFTAAGALTAQNVGIGVPTPLARLHIVTPASNSGTVGLRLQNPAGFGPVSLEFWSDPVGSVNEWRPGFIRSGDNGFFTGRLDFFTNVPGQRTDSILTVSLVRGRVGVRTTVPRALLHVADTGTVQQGGILVERDSRLGGSPRVGLVDDSLGSVTTAPV